MLLPFSLSFPLCLFLLLLLSSSSSSVFLYHAGGHFNRSAPRDYLLRDGRCIHHQGRWSSQQGQGGGHHRSRWVPCRQSTCQAVRFEMSVFFVLFSHFYVKLQWSLSVMLCYWHKVVAGTDADTKNRDGTVQWFRFSNKLKVEVTDLKAGVDQNQDSAQLKQVHREQPKTQYAKQILGPEHRTGTMSCCVLTKTLTTQFSHFTNTWNSPYREH